MSKWIEHIELNQVINKCDSQYDLSRLEESVPNEVKELIATELEKSKYLYVFANKIREAKSIAESNRVLQKVFDHADRWRVWCGF